MNKHLVLVGMMGSGKTTVAQWLHRHAGLPVYDTDHLIEAREGRPISEIFAQPGQGEPYFRRKEHEILNELLSKPQGVISTGGGLFIDPANRIRLLNDAVVFYLQAPVEELVTRTAKSSHRPLLAGQDRSATLEDLLQRREEFYRQAHHVIPVSERKPHEIGAEILRLYEETLKGATPLHLSIGFLGAGKMARAVASGLVGASPSFLGSIAATARTETSLAKFEETIRVVPVRRAADNLELVSTSDIIVIGVKPAQAAEALAPLREVAKDRLFISLMTGISLAKLEQWLGSSARVVRTMPNMPALIGEGITAYATGSHIRKEDVNLIQALLSAIGSVLRVEEKAIDAVTALSGSGPAYVYHFLHALIQGGVAQGLDPAVAKTLALQTVLGATRMAGLSPESPLELAAHVKSPGGTTLAACEVLAKGHWEETLQAAIAAARKRAEELSAS